MGKPVSIALLMGDEMLEPIKSGIKNKEFIYLCSQLTVAFGADFISPRSTDHSKALQVYNLAYEEGISKKDFAMMIKRFIKSHEYHSWVPAQFFKTDYDRLFPESWMTQLVSKNPESKRFLECYEIVVEGRPRHYWRWESTKKLPFKLIFPVKKEYGIKIKEAAPLTAEEKKEAHKQLDLAKELMKATSEISELKKIIEEKDNQIEKLETKLYNLL